MYDLLQNTINYSPKFLQQMLTVLALPDILLSPGHTDKGRPSPHPAPLPVSYSSLSKARVFPAASAIVDFSPALISRFNGVISDTYQV